MTSYEDPLSLLREMEARRGLRAATYELQSVSQELSELGDDELAAMADALCRKTRALLRQVTHEG